MIYEYKGSGYSNCRDIDISPNSLLSMYRSMLRIRLIEEAVENKYHEDEMKTPIHLVIGQEATCVGSAFAMREDDLTFASHRTHGNYLSRGGDLNAMFAEFFCKTTGCAGSRGGSMHLFDPKAGVSFSSAICGGPTPIATGAALAAQFKKETRVIVAFFGDGASEEGSTWESLNFSALKKLPIVYFCENNFYSVQSPLYKRQPPETDIYKKAESFGLKAVQVDGMNVLSVYEATKLALSHARKGLGPYFIEALTYRFRAHGGAGDDTLTGYRSLEERNSWEAICPLKIYGDYLRSIGCLHENQIIQMKLEIEKEIEEAFQFAKESPIPKEEDLFTRVYAE